MTKQEFLNRLAGYSVTQSESGNIVTITPNSNKEHFIKVNLAALKDDKVGVESSFIQEFENEPNMPVNRFFNFMDEYNCRMKR